MSNKIVILGGGAGGLVLSNLLRKVLTRDDEIVIVDKEKNHLFNPSMLWVMIGLRDENQIQKPLSLLEAKGIRYLNATVNKIDFENRKVLTSQGEENYDFLVIAMGANTYPEKLSGFTEAAHNLYEMSGIKSIKNSIDNFKKGRLVVLVASMPFKCPAAPYEAAFLLAEKLKGLKKEIQIEVITPEPMPMAAAGEDAGNMLVSMLYKKGIHFTPQHQSHKIDHQKKEILFNDQKSIPYDYLVGIPPHGLPEALKETPLVGESGWIKVHPKTLETKIDGVYAIGDVTGIPLSIGKPLPKAGVFAHLQAEIVAHRIEAKIKGVSPVKEFDGVGSCFLELGNGMASFASGNFYAEPSPKVKMKYPALWWHWGKVLFEKWWFWKWF